MYLAYFFFPKIQFLIFILKFIYTAFVRYIEQFLVRDFIEKYF